MARNTEETPLVDEPQQTLVQTHTKTTNIYCSLPYEILFLLAQYLIIHCLLMFCLQITGTTWEEARKARGEKGILMLLGGHTSSHIHAKRC